MADIIKQVAIFNKEDDSDIGTWTSRDIGAKASNISLSTPIAGISSNIEALLQEILPEEALSSGFIESNNGQLKTSEKTDVINNFFNTGLNNLNTQLSNLQTSLNGKLDNTQQATDPIIEDYLRRHSEDGSIKAGLKAEEISNLIYPQGSVYITFNGDNPANKLGGTWKEIEDGTFLMAKTGNWETPTTGGASQWVETPTITLTRSRNVGISNHSYRPAGSNSTNFNRGQVNGYGAAKPGAGYQNRLVVMSSTTAGAKVTFSGTTASLAHSITQPEFTGKSSQITVPTIPPYITVHMWKRLTEASADSYYVIDQPGIVEKVSNDIEQQVLVNVLLTEPTIAKWEQILNNA